MFIQYKPQLGTFHIPLYTNRITTLLTINKLVFKKIKNIHL